MKKLSFIVTFLFAVSVAACSQRTTPTALPTIVLESGNNPEQSAGATVSASGQTVPVRHVDLSFPLTGTIESVEVSLGDDVAEGDILVTLDKTVLNAELAQAQANLQAAESQYDYQKRVGTDEEHLKTAQAEVDRARAAVDSADAVLEQAELRAPFDGVIASVDISQAETVVPGQVVIVMGDLTKFQVETTDLGERDAPKVKIGQSADVLIEALNDTVKGQVVDVARLSTTLGGDVVYKVIIELDGQPQGLRWGMSAEVEIHTGD